MFPFDENLTLSCLFAFIVALGVAFASTPAVKMLAIRIKAVDVPKDNRRMHKVPIPRMGGLAIFAAFLISSILFIPMTGQFRAILIGALLLVVLGIVDDIVALDAKIKFGKLKTGSYTYQVIAADTVQTITLINKQFKVVK